jgi:uncharacterized protein with von Willebrand factor type A (vWA) domain
VSEQLVRFARALREEGIGVGTGAIAEFVRAAELTEDVYWAGRATLVSGRDELEPYDRVFAEFFGGAVRPAPQRRPLEAAIRAGRRASDQDVAGRLRPRGAEALAPALAQVPLRRSRRRRRDRRGEHDPRRTLRLALRTGGEPLRLARRSRALRPRRVVLLLDVSGSMSAVAERLVVHAHGALRQHRRWEVFCFATRLTRLTQALADGDPERAVARAAEQVRDWEGGTRIGGALKRFLDEHGHRGLARGAVVVVCSDGLDVGDPELLAEQMARLSLLAYRVVWLNPLAATAGYEPLAAGMRAALPYVDVFAPLTPGTDDAC